MVYRPVDAETLVTRISRIDLKIVKYSKALVMCIEISGTKDVIEWLYYSTGDSADSFPGVSSARRIASDRAMRPLKPKANKVMITASTAWKIRAWNI